MFDWLGLQRSIFQGSVCPLPADELKISLQV